MRLIWVSFFMLVSLSVFSQNQGLSVGWSISYMDGYMDELVFANNGSKDYMLSQLIWDIKGFYITGPRIEYQTEIWSYWLDVKFKLNAGDGHMEDYDWMWYLPDYQTLDPSLDRSDWTHYSHSDVEITRFIQGEMGISRVLKSWDWTGFSASAGLHYQQIRWEDTPNYLIYTDDNNPNGFRIIKQDFTEDNAINFHLFEFSSFLGLDLWFQFPLDFKLTINGRYYPPGYRMTIDEHVIPKDKYIDNFNMSQSLYTGVNLQSPRIKRWRLDVSFKYRWLLEAKGDTDLYYLSSDTYRGTTEDSAGSRGEYLITGVSISYQL